MTIGQNIKRLRKNADMTQEELAEMLSISSQAVSRWETDSAMPDISLLPALVNIFGVTSDKLLGIDSSKKVLDEYYRLNTEYANRGEIAKQLALWREAVQKFPSDYYCLDCLAHALYQTVWHCGDSDEIERNAKECIAICERILNNCKDSDLRGSAIQKLVYLYSNESFRFASEVKALEYAMMAGDLFVSREMLIEKSYYTKENISKKLHASHTNSLNYMDLLSMNLYDGIYDTIEDKIAGCKAALALWETLIYDGNYLFYHCRIETIWRTLAISYAELQMKNETIDALKHVLYHAKCYDTLPSGEQHYTSTFVREATTNASKHTKTYTETNVERALSFMKNKVFDFVRNDTEFIEMIKQP